MRHHERTTRKGARHSCRALLLAAALAGAIACGESDSVLSNPAPAELKPRPNVLLYIVDTLRADSLGCYGNDETATPQIDAFASEGVVYENAYANAPWTRASIASILTGLYPTRHLTRDRRDRLPEGLSSLAELLSEAGYTTGFVNTNPNVGSVFGFASGFDTMMELYAREKPGLVRTRELVTPSDEVTRRAIDWIDRANRPWLLVVLTIDPHSPYAPPERFDRYGGDYRGNARGGRGWLERDDLSDADKARIASLYAGEVSFNDDSFGALISHLRDGEQLDRTLVIFTSDHGEEFWEHGTRGHGKTLSEAVSRVPLVLRPPSARARTTRVERAVELVDIVPTVLALLDLPAPPGLDGRNLLAAETSSSRPLFAHLEMGGRRLVSVTDPPLKLVWDLEAGTRTLIDLAGAEREIAEGEQETERERLWAALEAIMMRSAVDRAERVEGELPADVQDALRALGYVE